MRRVAVWELGRLGDARGAAHLIRAITSDPAWECRHYAVMVPDVCGNVSVLTERGQVAGVRAERDPEWEYLARGGEPDATVDEPGTLAGALGALALLALLRRRRVARGPAAG